MKIENVLLKMIAVILLALKTKIQGLKCEIILKIQELSFACVDLNLYLDTHPDDEKALCLHNKYCKEYRDLTDKYQKVYGPLTINYPCNKWRWLESPWPWESWEGGMF